MAQKTVTGNFTLAANQRYLQAWFDATELPSSATDVKFKCQVTPSTVRTSSSGLQGFHDKYDQGPYEYPQSSQTQPTIGNMYAWDTFYDDLAFNPGTPYASQIFYNPPSDWRPILFFYRKSATSQPKIEFTATVTIDYNPGEYSITYSAGTGGSLTGNVSSAAPGTTVTLTPTANTGYQFSSYTTSPNVTITNNQFTMPENDVTITANFTKINYTVSKAASPSAGGSVTTSVSTATMGTEVTLTATPATGYQFSSWSSSPSVTISNNKFTMPASNVTITANFTKINYTVSKAASPTAGGTVTVSATSATMGTEITLTATANTGYQFSSWSSSPSVTISNNKFTMPASNVTITANFTKISYAITKAASPSAGGTVTSSANSATMGTEITLTATPATGYQFSGWSSSPAVTISNNKFTMPASAVSITATFTKITYTISKSASPSAGGTVTTGANSATMGTSVSVSQTPATGYYFNGWTTSPSLTISNGAFTMPASNVSITANYLKRSTATINKTTLTGGDSATLTISADKSTYTHSYKLSFGANMETSWTSVAANTSTVSISIPASWSNYIPNATTKANGTLTVKTYNGSTEIGSYTISGLTYAVPASAKPSIGTITKSVQRTIGGTTYANIGDIYTQGKCGVRIQTTASGSYSSTITSLSVSVSGYSGNSYNKTVTTGSIDFTTGLLTISGTTTITVTATDSRGRTTTTTTTITVTAYNAPSGTLGAWRVNSGGTADTMGTYAKYALTTSYSAIGSNSLTVTLTSQGSSKTSPAAQGDILPGSRQTFSVQNEYTITLTLTDAFQTVTITAKVPSARFIFYVNSTGSKLGFMKAAGKSIPSGKDSTIEFSGNSQIYIGDSTLEDYIRTIVRNM